MHNKSIKCARKKSTGWTLRTKRAAPLISNIMCKKIVELLKWLQDITWPVAQPICERLKNIGPSLINELENIVKNPTKSEAQ